MQVDPPAVWDNRLGDLISAEAPRSLSLTSCLPEAAMLDPSTPSARLAREGARRMLAQVLIAEADAFVATWRDNFPARTVSLAFDG
jgi:hypothetical protein